MYQGRKERSRLVERSLSDLPMAVPFLPRAALRVAHNIYIYTYIRGYMSMYSLYCPHNMSHGSNIITISCARLRLQLYYCPPYRNSPRGFCSPRACYDLFLSFPAAPLPSTSNVTENRGLAVVINDSLQEPYYSVSSMNLSRICTKSNL